MAFDLGDVVQAADAESVELAVQGLRNRSSDGGLADTWRADEAQDLALNGPTQEPHGDELENPLFDLAQTVVVPVKDEPGLLQAKRVQAVRPPRHHGQPVQVVSGDLVLLGLLRQVGKLLHLGVDGFQRLRRDMLALQALLELVDELIGPIALVLAQLLLDNPHLLSQHVLPLVLAHLLLDLSRNLELQPGELELLLHELQRDL
mmetsp:Transcript_125792/g.363916  ORF Transcript_125792/g.363916 Transcript_125792/m.363916 type:complete len:204 (-) Transcript_125792:1151-1762(-)